MNIIYECDICGAQSEDKSEVIACEKQGFNPLFGTEEKVFYKGDVVEIRERHLCEYSHEFIYRVVMHTEDNPGKTLWWLPGWISEEDLKKRGKEKGS